MEDGIGKNISQYRIREQAVNTTNIRRSAWPTTGVMPITKDQSGRVQGERVFRKRAVRASLARYGIR